MGLEKVKKKRVVLIDAPNLRLGPEVKINIIEFCSLLAGEKDTHVFYYYRFPELASGEDSFFNFFGFIHEGCWRELAKQGISFVAFPTIRNEEDRKIISDMATLLLRPEWLLGKNKTEIEEIVLVSGDGGFSRILELAKAENIKVKVIANEESYSQMLKNIADQIFFVGDLIEEYPKLILDP